MIDLRAAFEALVSPRAAWGLKRSRKGTYMNPAVARDWKWFKLGAQAATGNAFEPERDWREYANWNRTAEALRACSTVEMAARMLVAIIQSQRELEAQLHGKERL